MPKLACREIGLLIDLNLYVLILVLAKLGLAAAISMKWPLFYISGFIGQLEGDLYE